MEIMSINTNVTKKQNTEPQSLLTTINTYKSAPTILNQGFAF